jgi:adenylosuccinate lyase
MISRYTRKEMGEIWEPENRFRKWLDIEILACEALNRLGEIPDASFKKIKKKASFDIDRINEIEREVKHDVIAFLTSVSEKVGEDARYIHLGLTSSDILDTSFSLLLKEASEIIIKDIKQLLAVLKKKAFKHKKTVMMGRTHGIHAEPITFGLKMALWYEEMKRNLVRMQSARETISYGKISGAVGTFAHISPKVEKHVCKKLGLKPAPVSTQIIQRDRHAEFFSTLAIIASSLDAFAQEIRLLQRTEVREAEEYFSKGQKGSSAMPHKRNPIISENLSGLARLVRSHALAAFENVPLWHERDISHSSVERVIGPDSTILVDFMLSRFSTMVDQLVVYPEEMEKNIQLTKGIFFSQAIMLKLIKRGLSREDAYRVVQKIALKSWDKGENFRETIGKDANIKKYLPKKEIEQCCNMKHYLKNIDEIFLRVFGKKG